MSLHINGLTVKTYGDESKKAIVFIHGFPFDQCMWRQQVNYLKDDYYCVTFDVRGLGDSFVGDGQYTMEFYVSDLYSIMCQLQLYKPVLCGLSMGGYIALRSFEKRPEYFGGLILCNTKSEADDNAAKLKRSSSINQINTKGLPNFCDQFVTNCFADETPIENEQLFQTTLLKTYRQNPIGVKGAMIAIMSRTDTTEVLSQINIPTLVIAGAFDKIVPPPVMRAMADKIPGAEFAVVPRAGHLTALENPDNVNDLIDGFMKKNFIH